jgi:uncharacterized membrane protein YecN with MAPEG domain
LSLLFRDCNDCLDWLARGTVGLISSCGELRHSVTVISLAAAEIARALRFLLILLGVILLVASLVYAASLAPTIAGLLRGLLLAVLSLRRSAIRAR